MTEESMMILDLLREGKISAPEAERLLWAVRETGQPAAGPPPAAPPSPPLPTFGQTAQSAAKLAGRALDFLPKPKLDTGKVSEKIGEAAGDAFRAAKSAARDVAAEVSNLSRQTRQALHFDGASVLGADTGRPANTNGLPQATDAAQTEVSWTGASRLLLVNPYGDITVTGRDDLHGSARATLTKTSWADMEHSARLLLQQTFLVSRVENGTCRVEVMVPSDGTERLIVHYEIFVPQDMPLDVQTTFGSVETSGVCPALTVKSHSGRLAVRHPWADAAGEARLTTTSGDIVLDGWNAPSGSLRVETQSGDIEGQNLHCGREMTLISRSGDIALTSGSSGTRLQVETQSGGARLSDLRAAAIEVETLSGNLALKGASGVLTLKSASGTLKADDLSTAAVALNTVSGSAALSFAAPFSGSLAGTTVSGDLTVALWDNSNTRVDLNTTSGALTCSLPLADCEGDSLRRLAGKLGDATGSIKLQSVSGDLRIEKEAPPKRRARSKASGSDS